MKKRLAKKILSQRPTFFYVNVEHGYWFKKWAKYSEVFNPKKDHRLVLALNMVKKSWKRK